VRRQSKGCRAARTAVSGVAIVAGSLFLAGCGRGVASPTCTMKELLTLVGKGYLELPPSHDNDVGRGRIPDSRPDADLDANQRAALCAVYRNEKNLRG
jgi:hypothetical protein